MGGAHPPVPPQSAGLSPRRLLGLLATALLLVAEVLVFVELAGWIGPGWTVLTVVMVSLLGAWLLAREGLRAWRGFRSALLTGQPPGPRVTDGLVGLLGALLLAVPGLISGVIGALLLLPPGRHLARQRVQASIERRVRYPQYVFGPRRVRVQPTSPAGASDSGEVIEGEIVDEPGPGR